MPIIDELEQEYAGAFAFIRINADDRPDAVEAFEVMEFPTIFIITGKNETGYIKQELSGFTDEVELRERISSGIAPDRVVVDVVVTETSSTYSYGKFIRGCTLFLPGSRV